MSVRLACVLLVDERGRVLLQERDEHAPTAPNQWSMVGGHVEPGERFEDAVYRELAEETGVHLELGHLYLWREEELVCSGEDRPSRYHVYVGRVDGLTDADIVVGEGRQIMFVDPATVPDLDTSVSGTHFVTAFLASPDYQRLAGFVNGGRDEPV